MRWLELKISKTMKPLFDLEKAPLSGAARGVAFQLREGLGTLAKLGVRDLVKDVV